MSEGKQEAIEDATLKSGSQSVKEWMNDPDTNNHIEIRMDGQIVQRLKVPLLDSNLSLVRVYYSYNEFRQLMEAVLKQLDELENSK